MAAIVPSRSRKKGRGGDALRSLAKSLMAVAELRERGKEREARKQLAQLQADLRREEEAGRDVRKAADIEQREKEETGRAGRAEVQAGLEGQRIEQAKERLAFEKTKEAKGSTPTKFQAEINEIAQQMQLPFDENPLRFAMMHVAKVLNNRGQNPADAGFGAALFETIKETEVLNELSSVSQGLIADYILDNADNLNFITPTEDQKGTAKGVLGTIVQGLDNARQKIGEFFSGPPPTEAAPDTPPPSGAASMEDLINQRIGR